MRNIQAPNEQASGGARANSTIKGYQPRVRERELLRIAATLSEANPKASESAARAEVLEWATRQIGDQLPREAHDGKSFEHLRGGRTCIGTGFQDDGRAFWALRVDRPDVSVAQRTWTTEVVVGRSLQGGPPLFSLRLLVSSPEVSLHIKPAVPGLVRQVFKSCGLHHEGSFFDAKPWHVQTQAEVEELIELLADPRRSAPYLVCSVADGAERPSLDVSVLSKTTVGIARVVVLPAAHTRTLIQQLGRHRSVYGGAVRAYMPGFSNDANPYAHPIFRLDAGNQNARSALKALRWLAANESLKSLKLGREVVPFAAVRQLSLDFERERLKKSGSGDTEQLQTAQAQIEALKDDLRRSSAEAEQWMAEYEQADERAKSFEQQLRAAQFRIRQLTNLMEERGEDPDSSIALPQTWANFAEWCDKELVGRVELSGRARRETKSPEFEDPEAAARCLIWLAKEYRESRLNGSNGDLRRPIEEGIRNDRCGADSFDFDWQNRRVHVEWHIKNGGNTRDPRRCLRIYYFWDEDNQRVVIASMPQHVRTGAT